MDISPADSTPTSETSGPKAAAPYTPDPRLTPQSSSGAAAAAVSLATALPRLLSHPPSNQPHSQSMRPASQNNPNATNRYSIYIIYFLIAFLTLNVIFHLLLQGIKFNVTVATRWFIILIIFVINGGSCYGCDESLIPPAAFNPVNSNNGLRIYDCHESCDTVYAGVDSRTYGKYRRSRYVVFLQNII